MWIRLILLLIAWSPLFGQPSRGDTKTVGVGKGGVEHPKRSTGSNDSRQADQRGTKDLPLVVDAEGHHQTDDERAAADKERQHIREIESLTIWYAKLNAWSTFVLVLVGIGGICAAIWTLNEIREQTKATKASVDALINSERAWVLITEVQPPKLMVKTLGMSGASFNQFVFSIKNNGRTVARMGPPNGIAVVMKRDTTLPTEPQYGISYGQPADFDPVLHGRVMAPGETVDDLKIPIYPEIDEAMLEGLKSGALILWVYGKIEYRDFIREPHENRFCYRYVNAQGGMGPERFIPAGALVYHAHT